MAGPAAPPRRPCALGTALLLALLLLAPAPTRGAPATAAGWAVLPLRFRRHGPAAPSACRGLRQAELRGSVNDGFYAVDLNIGTPPQARRGLGLGLGLG
jgi:hypothetical protein